MGRIGPVALALAFAARVNAAELPEPHQFRKGRTPFSWNAALHYDAKLGVVLLHNPVTVWALRLDRGTAKITEARD